MINIYKTINENFDKNKVEKVLQEDLTEIDFEDARNEIVARAEDYLNTHACLEISMGKDRSNDVFTGFEDDIKQFGPSDNSKMPALVKSVVDILIDNWEIDYYKDKEGNYYFYKGGKRPRCLRNTILKDRLTEGELSKIDQAIREAGGKEKYLIQLSKEKHELKQELKQLDYDEKHINAGGVYDSQEEIDEVRKNLIDQINRLESTAKLVSSSKRR